MEEFLRTYWEEIVELFDKIYAYIKKWVLDQEAEENA